MSSAIRFLKSKIKYILLAYPLFALLIFFVVPLVMLIVTSFYTNVPTAFYEKTFTYENYLRFFTSSFYLDRMWLTIQISLITAILCLFLGYPTAYYLVRIPSDLKRNIYMGVIIGTLWITYIVRAYAWRIILAKRGPINTFLVSIGIFDKPHSFAPGYWATLIGLVYAFLPFMILSLYSSISNIDKELEEASLLLGANRLKTFAKIVLPLSKNGIISGFLLVFVLALGVYVTASILGGPSEWTLAIFIGKEITDQLNLPFGSAISIVLIGLVLGSLGLMSLLTTKASGGRKGGKEL